MALLYNFSHKEKHTHEKSRKCYYFQLRVKILRILYLFDIKQMKYQRNKSNDVQYLIAKLKVQYTDRASSET